jgi:hypothetical protein
MYVHVNRYPSLTIGMMVLITPILGWFGYQFEHPNIGALLPSSQPSLPIE